MKKKKKLCFILGPVLWLWRHNQCCTDVTLQRLRVISVYICRSKRHHTDKSTLFFNLTNGTSSSVNMKLASKQTHQVNRVPTVSQSSKTNETMTVKTRLFAAGHEIHRVRSIWFSAPLKHTHGLHRGVAAALHIYSKREHIRLIVIR